MSKKILVVSQYFWPENFGINEFCKELKERGYDMTILTGKPNYPNGKFYEGYSFFNKKIEYWNGIKLHRVPLLQRNNGSGVNLFLNYLSFAFFASLRALFIKEKFDLIFVYEPSPITVGFPAIIAKLRSKAKIIFWVQDLWPESISAAGGIKNKLVLILINAITKYIYKKSDRILVQSKSFIPYIKKQGIPESKLIYYPNSVPAFFNIYPKDNFYVNKLPSGFNLMFAGNVGESQSFGTLINAAVILKKRGLDINWVILGKGRMLDSIVAKVKTLNIDQSFFFLGLFPSIEMPKFFSCADALIVSLKKDSIFALTIPSKIQSYLACGRPIIASLDGEGAKIIEEANAGFTSPSENEIMLADSISKLYNMRETDRIKMGLNGRLYFEKEFEINYLLDKLEIIFAETV